MVKMQGRILAGDAEIYYRIIGKGYPFVLLHGNGENHNAFYRQVEEFRGRYKLILIDTRGHGNSTWGTKSLDFPTMAADIRTVLKALKVEKPVILGFSDGANLALQYAVMYPEEAKGLIAVSGNWNPKGLKPLFYRGVKWSCFWCRKLGRLSERIWRKSQLLDLMANQPRLTEEELRNISIPVLVLAADKDLIRDKHTKRLARLLPKGVLRIIPGANHMSVYQKPEEYHRWILWFMEGVMG